MAKLLTNIREIPERPRPAAKGLTPSTEAGLKITGWVLAVIGMVLMLFVIIDQLSDRPGYLFPDYALDRSNKQTSGTVDKVEPRVGKGSKYQKIQFHFKTETGLEQKGFSYAVRPDMSPGHVVDIEYYPADPSLSRVRKTNAARIPLYMFLGFSSILIIGVPLLFAGYRLSSTRLCILREGEIAEATIKNVAVDKRRGSATRHPRVVTYEFHDFSGMKFVNKGDLWGDPANPDTDKLNAGDTCLVAYARENPKRNFILTGDSFQNT